MTSLADIETEFKTALAASEANVQAFIQKVAAGAEVVMADLQTANQWIIANIGTINADFQAVLGFAKAVDPSNPTVAKAIADAQLSMSALNAYESGVAAGDQVGAVVDAYTAIKQASAASSTIAAAASAVVAASPNAAQVVSPPTPPQA